MFFFQICEVGGLVIIHNNTQSNLAIGYNLLLEYVDFKVFFPHNVEIMGHLKKKKKLCTCHKV
jgi:hypothetical protein